MLSSSPATGPDCVRAFETVLDPMACPRGRLSQLSALHRLFLASTPSSEYDVETATWTPLQRPCNWHTLETENNKKKLSSEMLDKDFPTPATPIMPTASTSRISDTTEPPCSQFNDLLKYFTVSDGPPVRGKRASDCRPNEEPITTTPLPWCSRTLASFTWYGKLSVACTPEEFALVHTKLQQEWSFDGGFLIGLAAVNVTILAITPDSSFKINSYAHITVATSSAACGLGIACDVWFLLRYIWVGLDTFIYRCRDINDSYISFSLSSRMPTFCTIVSSISLVVFLGIIAFDASPIGVLVIGILVGLVMIMQFIVYGMHKFAALALRVWRAGAISTVNVVKRFRGFGHGG